MQLLIQQISGRVSERYAVYSPRQIVPMEMKRIAIIGAGISGLSIAHMLRKENEVTIYEAEDTIGGLIRCERVNGSLFHTCGGHIFNTKRQEVLDWLWNYFDKEKEFRLAERNSVIFMPNGQELPYPIENYIYLLPEDKQKAIIQDLLSLSKEDQENCSNFGQFLQKRFGQTLYETYFKPYNEKIWQSDLSTVPLDWLDGKLPMPKVEEILYNNFNHVVERQFVHSTFYYEKEGGSQFIVDRLLEGLDIRVSTPITSLRYEKPYWFVCDEQYDAVVFCGNIRYLPEIVEGIDMQQWKKPISDLQFHGTTTVFCELDQNPYSWIYLPDSSCKAHRIICTGNFAPSNNANGHFTGTIEFTDEISEEEIKRQLAKIPLHPQYITHRYHPCTYPIQDQDTRAMLQSFKKSMVRQRLYMTGRFVDWEYYNMDAAIYAAMQTARMIN